MPPTQEGPGLSLTTTGVSHTFPGRGALQIPGLQDPPPLNLQQSQGPKDTTHTPPTPAPALLLFLWKLPGLPAVILRVCNGEGCKLKSVEDRDGEQGAFSCGHPGKPT